MRRRRAPRPTRPTSTSSPPSWGSASSPSSGQPACRATSSTRTGTCSNDEQTQTRRLRRPTSEAGASSCQAECRCVGLGGSRGRRRVSTHSTRDLDRGCPIKAVSPTVSTRDNRRTPYTQRSRQINVTPRAGLFFSSPPTHSFTFHNATHKTVLQKENTKNIERTICVPFIEGTSRDSGKLCILWRSKELR